MSGAQQGAPSAQADLATIAAGVQLARAHPFVPAQVGAALAALLRLVAGQHEALQAMRRELDQLKGN